MNRTGYAAMDLDAVTMEFIRYSSSIDGRVLEIGSGYGYAAIEAAKQGATVVCNDVEQKHLDVIQDKAIDLGLKNIEFCCGEFPEQVKLHSYDFDAILVARVLHLFDGELLQASLMRIYDLLKPSGKVFIVCDTPYLGNLNGFVSVFQDRVKKGVRWPGEIHDASQYVIAYDKNWPKLIHLFDKETLKKELELVGFRIEYTEYLSRDDYPDDRKSDGRESVGVIAHKK